MIWAKFKYIYLTIAVLSLLQIYFAVFAAPLDKIWSITANGPLVWLMVMRKSKLFLTHPFSFSAPSVSFARRLVRVYLGSSWRPVCVGVV